MKHNLYRFFYTFFRSIYFKIFGSICKYFDPPLFKNVSWGNDNPDKRFMLIRHIDRESGLCSHVLYNLGWIDYALSHGMIPIVDLQKHPTLYHKAFQFKRSNVWECFFEQPLNYKIVDIFRSKNITIRDGFGMPEVGCDLIYWRERKYFKNMYADNDSWRHYQLVCSRYIRILPAILERYKNNEFEDALAHTGVIGVLARGTDYVKMRPSKHPIQPTTDQLIAKIKEFIVDGRLSFKIYLVTEDASIEKQFQAVFPDKLISSRQKMIDYVDGLLVDCQGIMNNKERASAYLVAIHNLSRCPCLIAGKTAGSLTAALMSNEGQIRYFFELGDYP